MSAAFIAFDPDVELVDLDSLDTFLQTKLGQKCERTEWRGFTTIIPQILVLTRIPFAIQINCDEYVAREVIWFAERSSDDFLAAELPRLQKCRCRLEIVSASAPRPGQDQDGTLHYIPESTIDPEADDTRRILLALGQHVNGFTYDLVNGQWISMPLP